MRTGYNYFHLVSRFCPSSYYLTNQAKHACFWTVEIIIQQWNPSSQCAVPILYQHHIPTYQFDLATYIVYLLNMLSLFFLISYTVSWTICQGEEQVGRRHRLQKQTAGSGYLDKIRYSRCLLFSPSKTEKGLCLENPSCKATMRRDPRCRRVISPCEH